MGGGPVIFVTVGSMLPFDRLIRAADAWAPAAGQEVFAQIGNSGYKPLHMPFAKMLTPGEFTEKLRSACLVVAHAGMGTVISAMEAGKPIVVLPRRAADREVTTDHQIHTANWLKDKPGVLVAATEADLAPVIAKAMETLATAATRVPDSAPPELIARIRSFLGA